MTQTHDLEPSLDRDAGTSVAAPDQNSRPLMVLVTGGSGFIGSALVAELLRSGHAARVVSRDPARARRDLPPSVDTLAWQPAAGPAPVRAFEDVDVVVNLAGESVAGVWTPSKRRAIRESRVEGTRSLVAGIRMLKRRPRALISASAIGFYGDRGDVELHEGEPPGTDFLARVCRDWEMEATNAEELGLVVATTRFGIVLGRDGGAYPQLERVFRLGAGGKLGSGRQWWSWIHLDDLVSLIARLVNRPVSGPVNGTSPTPIRQAEFANILADRLRRPAIVPAPAFAMRTLLGDSSSELLSSRRVVPRRAEALGFEFRHQALESALQALRR